jgi:ankyrin repeat protein
VFNKKLILFLAASFNIFCQDSAEKTPQEILESGNKGRQMLVDLKNGNRHLAIASLKSGANPNVKNESGETALIIATQNNDAELVTLLLKYGADPNVKNNEKNTPLIIALLNKSFESALILIKHPRTDINLEGVVFKKASRWSSFPKQKDGYKPRTPIQLVAELNNMQLLQALVEKKVLYRYYPHFDITDQGSPLEWAIRNNNLEMINLFLSSYNLNPDIGARVAALNRDKDDIAKKLILANKALINHEIPYPITWQISEKFGIRWHPSSTYAFSRGHLIRGSVLHHVITNKPPELAQTLIENAPKLEDRDGLDLTPLMVAAIYGKSDAVSQLLNRGANPTIEHKTTGKTVLQLAIRAGDHKRIYEAIQAWKTTHQAASSSICSKK